ncbi:MAG: DNA polymerase III subunit gamma/tau [Lachnospiraceae bacterium]|nr:DNA polymerase III subunit gamma/tau [Lachnospiraceae bacterium]
MSYVALYRKFRPGEFEDVKGQEHIIKALKNQVKTDRIGHAYMFSGTRGTGKTTVAKIMAKAVNCENPVDGSPCNKCAICQSINNHTSLNVIEIDAASNNGVDNIRQIVDEVQYSPTEGKYKVYIIDEVHMLSTGAFNALLKTLEEPPAYVIFILATTEPHKIPVTILSRCQRYEFKRMQVSTIVERINELAVKENVDIEERAALYIAKMADGAMRDALSLLDQCLAFYQGEKLTHEKVLEVLGAVDNEVFMQMFECISQGKVSKGLGVIDDIIAEGKDLSQFVINFTWFMRNIMIIKSTQNTKDIVDMTEEKILELRNMAANVDVDTLMRYIRIFSELSNQLKYATQKRVVLEAAFIKMCKPQMEDNIESLNNRIAIIENKIENGIITTGKAVAETEESIRKDSEEDKKEQLSAEEKKELLDALPQEMQQIAAKWNDIVMKVSITIREFVKKAYPSVGNNNELILNFNDALAYEFVSKEAHLAEIADIVITTVNKNIVVKTNLSHKSGDKNDMIDISKLINAEVTYVE